MAVRTERSDKWVRAFVGDTTVVDSREPLLFYEETFPVPGYAFARADVRTDLLRPAEGEPPREPFFFLPKGPVSHWFDLEAGGASSLTLPGPETIPICRIVSCSAGNPGSSTGGWKKKRR